MISVCKVHYECISSGLSSLPTAKTFCNSSPAVRSGGREVEGGGGGGLILRRKLYLTNTNEGREPRNIRRVKKSV